MGGQGIGVWHAFSALVHGNMPMNDIRIFCLHQTNLANLIVPPDEQPVDDRGLISVDTLSCVGWCGWRLAKVLNFAGPPQRARTSLAKAITGLFGSAPGPAGGMA